MLARAAVLTALAGLAAVEAAAQSGVARPQLGHATTPAAKAPVSTPIA